MYLRVDGEYGTRSIFPCNQRNYPMTDIYTKKMTFGVFNSSPNEKILDQSKLKAFAEDNLKVIQMAKFLLVKVKKHCGERRKCRLPAFSSFPTMFSKVPFFKVVKSRDYVV